MQATRAVSFLSVFVLGVSVAAAGGSDRAQTLAIIGDAPYGADQIGDFPTLLADIDADADVTSLVHVGDIKSGSSVCDTPYFDFIREQLDTLRMPVVLTLGDNEWTDCHRSRAGKFDPLDRLAELRSIFYPFAGVTRGARPTLVVSQAWFPRFREFPENQLWARSRVVYSAVHVVGSENGLRPWFADDTTDDLEDDPVRREAEVDRRTDAGLHWLVQTFVSAHLLRAKAVVIFMHADTFMGTTNGFVGTVQLLADLAADFGKPVLLVQGDSHTWVVDRPLENGSEAYGIERKVPNLTRIVVEGATTGEWLKLRVDPRDPAVFSWQRVMR